MKPREPSEIILEKASDGTVVGVVYVPVDRNGLRTAVLEEADLRKIVGLGFSTRWHYLNSPYGSYVVARTKGSHRWQTLARVIMDAPEGHTVKYHDGNTLNLRRSNLYLAPSTRQIQSIFKKLDKECKKHVA